MKTLVATLALFPALLLAEPKMPSVYDGCDNAKTVGQINECLSGNAQAMSDRADARFDELVELLPTDEVELARDYQSQWFELMKAECLSESEEEEIRADCFWHHSLSRHALISARMQRFEPTEEVAAPEPQEITLESACDSTLVLNAAVIDLNERMQAHGAIPGLEVTEFRESVGLTDIKQPNTKYCKATAVFNNGMTDSALIVIQMNNEKAKIMVLPNDAGY